MQRIAKIFSLLTAILLGTLLQAQNYYDQQWKKVNDNYTKGVVKSSLPLVLDIQKQAMKDNNTIELINALKAEFVIVNQTRDDEKNDAVSQFFDKIRKQEKNLKGEELLVYRALQIKFVDDYFQRNQWKIQNRTNLDNQDFAQIESWSKLDFKKYFTQNFDALHQDKAGLEKALMSKYKQLFTNTGDITYFPSVQDWVALQEINFLRNSVLFTPNELKENNKKILAIYNSRIASAQGNSKLFFEYEKAQYEVSFNQLTPEEARAKYEAIVNAATDGDYKINILNDIANSLSGEKPVEAMQVLKKAKDIYPKSEFQNNIKNTENSITAPSININYEHFTLPGQPVHLSVNYKNAGSFALNIYQVTDLNLFIGYLQDSYKNPLIKVAKQLVKKENFELKNTGDYKNHISSVELSALKNGLYIAEYLVEGKSQGSYWFSVNDSRIIYNKIALDSKNNVLRLIDRNNGESKKNTNLNFYDYSTYNKPAVKSSAKTNQQGIFVFPENKTENYKRYLVEEPGTKNISFIEAYGGRYYNPATEEDDNKAQIFLDRAIYRPGQTVYFKVINTRYSNKKETVVAGMKQTITLVDSNGEDVSEQTFTTNEFGSYNGSFILPKGKLNGEFTLETGDDTGSRNFRVEEYKRPNFEITFEDIKGEYKFGQTIHMKGKAVSFSGVPLSNATLNYEIKKQDIRYRYFSWFRPTSNENSILGTIKTNEKGEFDIPVDLQKDEKLKGIQVNEYVVNASVTDINGETQENSVDFRVASVSHFIEAEEVKTTFANEDIKIKVAAKNYNNQKLEKSYQAKLSLLDAPDRIFRNNFRNAVQDQPLFSRESFIQKFPHDYFDKSELPDNWKIKQTVLQKTTADENLDLGKLSAGKYKLELFNIEGQDTIKTVKTFEVWDRKSLSNQQKPFLKLMNNQADYQRGEKAKVYLYSAIPNAKVYIYTQTGNGETKTEEAYIKNGVLEYETLIPSDAAVKKMNLQFTLAAYNDIQTVSTDLLVRNETEPMKIELTTFRDKIQPGSKEKWTVKITGKNKEKAVAELLANMYDMSLDQFAVNTYTFSNFNFDRFMQQNYGTGAEGLEAVYYNKREKYLAAKYVNVPYFDWFDQYGNLGGKSANIRIRGNSTLRKESVAYEAADKKIFMDMVPAPVAAAKNRNIQADSAVVIQSLSGRVEGVKVNVQQKDLDKVPVRTNLNETAFFYPNLKTDKDGNVSFEFTSPEALTKWKLMFLAHDKNANAAALEQTIVTQKDFSVTPNYPRFLREGDELNMQVKLNNLVEKALSGSVQLQILNAETNEDISSKFGLNNLIQNFSINGNSSQAASWTFKVPNDVSGIIIKTVAKAGQYSDGEQKAIPVLPNRMLVTDAQSVFVKEGETKTFVLEHLKSNTSTTVTNVSNTLELTTNPIWEVLFALPSLKNDINNSADVVFNKWFADVLASEIFKANPKMKKIFEEYQDKGLLESNLEKNQELKQLLLEETPWVLEAKDEKQQMQMLARLFDANNMRNSILDDWSQLKQLQNGDGGFSWYAGSPSSFSTSLYILKNLGKINEWLKDKGGVKDYQNSAQDEMTAALTAYVDREINRYWKPKDMNPWNNLVLDYLDTRHYWETKYPLKNTGATLKSQVIAKAKTAKITDFTFFGLSRAALLFNDYGLKDVSNKLMTYLKETSVDTKTQGIYWKQNLNDWGWYASKAINHALAMQAFNQLKPNDTSIEDMKIWLITQKEVNNWSTSRATAEVIYTIMNSGKSWTTPEADKATVVWGGRELTKADTQATGYIKSSVKSPDLDKKLAEVTITKPGSGIVQGGIYWQYYEDLDKVKSSETYISVTKELYRKVKTENGEELKKITTDTPLRVGDKITVRMILNTDRPMEYIHIKDMRAAGFEPVDVLSGYQWKNNLGYYQATKDASTNFYIEQMPKGKYVFEYDVIANIAGKFSNGITTMQNYYAPQMNAHTQGTNVTVAP
ncbi:TPA: alpha-2-macroglobulin family protein [Elizabethkingia meningoseptica]